MAAGLGLEFNMNSREYFAGGAVLGVDYNLFQSFAVGLSVTVSNNFTVFTALEPAAMFRWYPLGKDHTGFFVQADAGVFLYMENEQTVPMFLGGLRTGLRLPLGQTFYIEPYGRAGYPFAFGIGVSVGMRFLPARKKAGSAVEKPDKFFIEETVEESAEEPEAKEEEYVQGRYYVVRRGDTLSRIAFIEYENGYWWPMIAAANPFIQNPHLIYPGQRLYIPPREEATAELTEPTGEPVPGRYYIVRRGDTAGSIALRAYGNADRWPIIAAANSFMQSPRLIYPDHLLYIPLNITETE